MSRRPVATTTQRARLAGLRAWELLSFVFLSFLVGLIGDEPLRDRWLVPGRLARWGLLAFPVAATFWSQGDLPAALWLTAQLWGAVLVSLVVVGVPLIGAQPLPGRAPVLEGLPGKGDVVVYKDALWTVRRVSEDGVSLTGDRGRIAFARWRAVSWPGPGDIEALAALAGRADGAEEKGLL